jgi:hypothetical protein
LAIANVTEMDGPALTEYARLQCAEGHTGERRSLCLEICRDLMYRHHLGCKRCFGCASAPSVWSQCMAVGPIRTGASCMGECTAGHVCAQCLTGYGRQGQGKCSKVGGQCHSTTSL